MVRWVARWVRWLLPHPRHPRPQGPSPMTTGWALPATNFPTGALAKHAAEFESTYNDVWQAMGFLVAAEEPLPLLDEETKQLMQPAPPITAAPCGQGLAGLAMYHAGPASPVPDFLCSSWRPAA